MFEMTNVKDITVDELRPEVQKLFDAKYRFLIITCIDLGDQFEFLYQFDMDLVETTLRLKVAKVNDKATVPSISLICISALLIENEIQDLFGVVFADILIDYKNMLLKTDPDSAPYRVANLIVQNVKSEKSNEGGQA